VPATNSSAFNPTATGPNGQPVGGAGMPEIRLVGTLHTRTVPPP
jgi:hypothetical protein